MYKIYLIKDINHLEYVGKTKLSLKERLRLHRNDRNRGVYCSSQKLDLDNCFIELIEQCDKSQSKQREKYWINYIDCVNDVKFNFDTRQYNKQRYIDNKEQLKQYDKERYEYKNSWGGDHRYNNNLLRIDKDYFS